MNNLSAAKYVRLTTFTKDGRRKHTPVWIAELEDGNVATTTDSDSWKVKRIRANSGVEVAISDGRGIVEDGSQTTRGNARIVSSADSEYSQIEHAFLRKYRLMYRHSVMCAQIALPVSDVDRSERFYGENLGLLKLFRFGDLSFFDCSGNRLMLERSRNSIKKTNSICHYFNVDRIEEAVLDRKSRKMRFGDDPHLIARMPDHELWMTFFKDPEGHMPAWMEERRHAGSDRTTR